MSKWQTLFFYPVSVDVRSGHLTGSVLADRVICHLMAVASLSMQFMHYMNMEY